MRTTRAVMLLGVHPLNSAVRDAVQQASRDGHGSIVLLEGDLEPVGDLPRADVLSGGFDVAGTRGAYVTGEETYTDPDALVAAVRDRLGSERPVVLILADLDLGLPTLNWSDYFLLRALPPLVSAHPLVVVASVSTAGLDAGIVAELSERG